MRHATISPCSFWTLLTIIALAQAALFSPFLSALDPFSTLEDLQETNTTSPEDVEQQQQLQPHELLKRATACPTGFNSCSNLGAPQLCCVSNAICSADYAGHVACCPSGAACTGTISSIITGGTVLAGGGAGVATTTTSNNGLLNTAATTTTTTGLLAASTSSGGNGLVLASATTAAATSATSGNGFVIDGSTTVATLGSGGVRAVEMPMFANFVIALLAYVI